MTRFGFVIDQRSCIGCHACTVACKEEHGVELGVFRTWVKYIEQGEFPDTRRYFSVLLCNHCDDAPCVDLVVVGENDDGVAGGGIDGHGCGVAVDGAVVADRCLIGFEAAAEQSESIVAGAEVGHLVERRCRDQRTGDERGEEGAQFGGGRRECAGGPGQGRD